MSTFTQSNISFGVDFGDRTDELFTSATLLNHASECRKNNKEPDISLIDIGDSMLYNSSSIVGIDLSSCFLEEDQDCEIIDFTQMQNKINNLKPSLTQLLSDLCSELNIPVCPEPQLYHTIYRY